VRGAAGGYRPLDQRTLDALRRADSHARGHQVILDEIEAQNAALEAASERGFKNDIEAISRDRFKQWRSIVDQELGATNIPRQDLQAAMDEQLSARIDWDN